MDPVNKQILQQAVQAAREGDLDAAREMVANVLEDDEENVQAWLLLARMVSNVDERRMALTTVLNLDPNNERAQQMLEALESAGGADKKDEIIPGISRQQFLLMMGGLILLVVVLLVIVVMANSSESEAERNARGTEAAFTDVARTAIARETGYVTSTQRAVLAITSAWLTEITPTSTPTPTFTPTPTPTATDTRASALPPPPELPLSGQIVAWSSERVTSNENLQLVTFDLTSATEITRNPIADLQGRLVTISPDGQLLLYMTRETFGDALVLSSITGEDRRSGLEDVDLDARDIIGGALSPSGTQYAFIAQATDNRTNELYLMTLPSNPDDLIIVPGSSPETAPAFSVIRLTLDEAGDYSYPTFSPDGSQILVVRDSLDEDNPGRDLSIINIANRTRAVLTNDGDALAESHATWSPLGNLVVFSAIADGQDNHDLYIVSAEGLSQSIQLTDNPADEIYPQYSPDGAYLAYSSNQANTYNIFLIDMNTRQLVAQLTDRDRPTFIGNWINTAFIGSGEGAGTGDTETETGS